MFELNGVVKKFDAVVALNNASLVINQGEIKALLGSNGSGKSTMVKVLGGLVNPNNGTISIDGKRVRISNARDARRLGISVAYQDLSLIPKLSVMDNILLGQEPKGALGIVNKKKVKEHSESLLKRLNVNCGLDELVSNLPSSTQSLVEVVKALSWQPRLLLLDEVTASLHHNEVDTLFKVLLEEKHKGLSTVVVTHRMGEIFKICDSATVLRGGQTVVDAKVSDLNLDEIIFHMTGKYPDKGSGSETVNKTNFKAEKILEVKKLRVGRKVRDVSMEVQKGEIIGIGGLQGMGQSEFIRAVLGVEKHQKGEVLYKGKKVNYKTAAAAIGEGMGFISGDRNREAVFPIRTVAENIYSAKVSKGSGFGVALPKEVNRFANEAVEKYNIKIGALNHPASSLSGGNQQKLVVGRWLSIAPDLLLLDDPTKGVDIEARKEIHVILKQAIQKGMTVIIVSSDNEELLDIADRIYVFYEGRISAVLSDKDRTEEKLVAGMMSVDQSSEGMGAKS